MGIILRYESSIFSFLIIANSYLSQERLLHSPIHCFVEAEKTKGERITALKVKHITVLFSFLNQIYFKTMALEGRLEKVKHFFTFQYSESLEINILSHCMEKTEDVTHRWGENCPRAEKRSQER